MVLRIPGVLRGSLNKLVKVINGVVKSSVNVAVPDDAYDATTWNGSVNVPTKNAVRDKIELLTIGATSFKVGTFNRDVSLTSGNIAYTGVGFTPKAIIFLAAETSGSFPVTSIGFDDGSSHADWVTLVGLSPSSGNGGHSIVIGTTNSDLQSGVIASFDVDGFTITWAKAGTPTGTAKVFYMALK